MTVRTSQPRILDSVPPVGRFLVFDLRPGADPRTALARLRDATSPAATVIGVGQPLVLALGTSIPGLRPFPAISGRGYAFPSTQGALWVFTGAPDATAVHDAALQIAAAVEEAFVVREEVPAFVYRGGRDLSGFEDGTENPRGEKAVAAAIVEQGNDRLGGSSFVAVQRWRHDLAAFGQLAPAQQDALIGRARESNEELEDAPASAHVKRTAQESFEPAAFMVRRSMPWGNTSENGLYFVAYGHSLDGFERMLVRMSGLEDGITDGLLTFSRALSGGYYWCPPVVNGRLDLSPLGL